MSKKLKIHNFEFLESSFKTRIATFRHTNTTYNLDLPEYLEDIRKDILTLIREQQENYNALKVNLVISLKLKNLEESSDYILRLKNVEIYLMTDLEKYYVNQIELFNISIQEL